MTAKKENFHKELDLNNDGHLSGIEVILMLSPFNAKLAFYEARYLIKTCDLNGDEVLSKEEILNEVEKFMSSKTLERGWQLKDEL